jgi:phosphoadenosine phosphosulfate reductase
MERNQVLQAVEVIERFAAISQKYYNKPITLAFSGGKDSIVLEHLAKSCMAKYQPVMVNTTIEMPSTLPFIRRNYPYVAIQSPPLNFADLVRKKGFLPSIKYRYCCNYLKKIKVERSIVLTGVRRAESWKRKSRGLVEKDTRGKRVSFELNDIDTIVLDDCFSKRRNLIINPLIDWSDADIYEYISANSLELPSSYSLGYKRLGCVFCPLSSRSALKLDIEVYSAYVPFFLRLIAELVRNNDYCSHLSGNEHVIFDFWLSKLNVEEYKRKYLNINEFCVYDYRSI